MRLLLSFVRTAFLTTTIYRLDFWVGILATLIGMYATHSLWRILYTQSPGAFGMSLEQMTTYGVLGMIMAQTMSAGNQIQSYIAQQVRMGTLEVDLLKPLAFPYHMFCRNFGEFLVGLVTRGVVCFGLAFLILGMRAPDHPSAFLAFLASLFLGYLVLFGISLLMGMLAIVTLDIRSYSWAYGALVRFASGQMVPLWMFSAVSCRTLSLAAFQKHLLRPYIAFHRRLRRQLCRGVALPNPLGSWIDRCIGDYLVAAFTSTSQCKGDDRWRRSGYIAGLSVS